jgi:hypothetical protein
MAKIVPGELVEMLPSLLGRRELLLPTRKCSLS